MLHASREVHHVGNPLLLIKGVEETDLRCSGDRLSVTLRGVAGKWPGERSHNTTFKLPHGLPAQPVSGMGWRPSPANRVSGNNKEISQKILYFG